MNKRLIEQLYAPNTIDAAKQTEALDTAQGNTIAYAVVASASNAPSGMFIQIQGSLDGTNFFPIGSAVEITGNGNFSVAADNLAYRFYRLSYTRTSGDYVATTRVLVKGKDI